MTRWLLLAIAALWASVSNAQEIDYHRPGDLAPVQDQGLRLALESTIISAGYGDLVERDLLAVSLVLMDEAGVARLAMLNGHHMVYAASLPKLAILLGAMVASQRGQLELQDSLLRDLHAMIRVSCNDCATRALDRVGRQRLLDILQDPAYAFYDPQRAGGLWVGKDYARAGAYQRDPLHGLSHGATAYQVSRLYYRLETGDLLDPQHTALMREILARPGINHKFVKALENERRLDLLRKSGSWRDFHADSVLVRQDGRRYILVGLVQHPQGEAILQQLARALHILATAGRDDP